MNRNLDHIARLEERNRLKRLSSLKSKEELDMAEKERGFSTHFRGANASAADKVNAVKRFAKVTTPTVTGKLSALSRLAAAFGGSSRDALSSSSFPSTSTATTASPADFLPSDASNTRKGWAVDPFPATSAAHTSDSAPVRERERSSNFNQYIQTRSGHPADESLQDEFKSFAGDLDEQTLLASPLRSSRESARDASTPPRPSIVELLRISPSRCSVAKSFDEPEKKTVPDLGHELMQRISSMDPSQQAMLLQLLDMSKTSAPKSPVKPGSVAPIEGQALDAEWMGPADGTSFVPRQPAVTAVLKDGITIRIRIFNTWGTDAKFVSLAGVRLHLDEGVSVDIMKFFSVHVLSGMQPVPATSDAARKISTLFMSSVGSSLSWAGRLEVGLPLEIRLQSDPNMNLAAWCGGESKLISSLKIAMWNAEGSGGGINGLSPSSLKSTTLPAKDVDIYVGSKCIWSGQLPLLEGGKVRRMGRELIAPSLLISVFPTQGGDRPQQDAPRSPKRSDSLLATRSSAEESNALPDWLSGLKEATHANDLEIEQFTPRPRTRPASGRKSVQVEETVADYPFSSVSPKKEVSAEKRRRSRRDSSAVGTSPEDRLDNALKPPKHVSAEGDAQLRRSINAISQADRLNRGRIDLATTPTRPNDSIDDDYLDGSVDSLVNSSFRVAGSDFYSPAHATQPVATASASSQPSEPSSISSAISSARSDRNKRISQVQDAVQSTLAGLAGIMSDIQLNRRSPPIAKASPSALSESGAALSSPALQPVKDEKFFSVPILPTGRVLHIDILSTWGDVHYVGLNGIDIFDSQGSLIVPLVSSQSSTRRGKDFEDGVFIESIDGNPRDINVLPEYDSDPRTVTNLIDGSNFTRDDLHVWLAPLGFYMPRESEPKSVHGVPIATITVTFTRAVSLSMLRIFNYNKSRTYSYRGVRCCRIFLDNQVIFNGEIRIAPGLLVSADEASEVILFTTDQEILQKVANHDENAGYYMDDSTSKWVEKLMNRHFERRPSTADRGSPGSLAQNYPIGNTISRHVRAPTATVPRASSMPISTSEHRPSTSAIRSPLKVASAGSFPTVSPVIASEPSSQNIAEDDDDAFMAELRDAFPESPPAALRSSSSVHSIHTSIPSPVVADDSSYGDGVQLSSNDLVSCCAVKLIIESSWGDASYVGLTGVSVLATSRCTPLHLDPKRITANPRDLSAVGCYDDPRTPDKLLDGVNNTTDTSHMWLIPFTQGSTHSIQFEWSHDEKIGGIRMWNYNKAGDEVRGAKVVTIIAYTEAGTGQIIGQCILRPAPGCDGIPFDQTIYFRDVFARNRNRTESIHPVAKYVSPPTKQDYEVPYLPSGQLWKFTLYENYSDGYYIGLDGIELFDESNERISPSECGVSVTAVPHSLQDLTCESGAADPRTPDKLFFPLSDEAAPGEEKHVPWLAPIARCMTKRERASAAERVQNTTRKSDGELSFLPDNAVFMLFQSPVTLSVIRMYNYSKTVARGVKTLAIHVDGKLIFMGNLLPADRCVLYSPTIFSTPSHTLPFSLSLGFHYFYPTSLLLLLLISRRRECTVQGIRSPERRGQSIIFVADPKVVRVEKERVPAAGAGEQDVLCIDERKVMVKSRAMYDSALTPWSERETTTEFSNAQRPATSQTKSHR